MGQLERLLAGISVLIVFVYVALRAVYVPVFHDEASTFFLYILTGDYVPFKAHWDANNHILNSALSHICLKVFGPEPWSIRLPNVLAFLVYGYFGFKIAQDVRRTVVRWILFIGLLTSTFVVEFFALTRGYGMSIAFLLAAVYYLSKYLQETKLKFQFLVWFWLILAIAANLSLLNTYLIILVIVLLYALIREDKSKHLSSVFVAVTAFCGAAYYAFELKNRGLLYTGKADGFISTTVRSLMLYELDVNSIPLATIITVVAVIAAAVLVFPIVLNRLQWNAVSLSAVLLILNGIGSVMLNVFFGTNFPENRVGLYFIPLFLITAAGAIDKWSFTYSTNVKWLSLGFLILPSHFLTHTNLNTTVLWPEWHVSDRLFDELSSHIKSNGAASISAPKWIQTDWAYYSFLSDSKLQLFNPALYPDTNAEFILGRPQDFEFDKTPYTVVHSDKHTDFKILKRTRELVIKQTRFFENWNNYYSGSDEFFELVNVPVPSDDVHSGNWELLGTLNIKSSLFKGQLVLATESVNGGLSSYDFIDLLWLNDTWNSDMLHIKRTFHFPVGTKSMKLYFWNISKDEIEFTGSRLEFKIAS